MMRMRWKQLAFGGLAAATLSLGVAACGDDTTSGADMAVTAPDMSANAGDMATGTPGNAQVTLADIVGTAYQGSTPVYRLHALKALASFSNIAGTPDPSSNLTLGPPPTGCSIYRYDIGAGKVPGSDADAGPVTMTGYNAANIIGVDTQTGTKSPPDATITCVRGGPLMTYSCFYGTMPNLTDGGSAGMGALTDDIIYPPLPAPSATPPTFGCPGAVLAASATGPFYCEQYPIATMGVATIDETVTGGADYPAPMNQPKKIGNGGGLDGGAGQFPDQPTIVSVKSGSTEISGLDIVSGSITAGTMGCPATSVNGCQRNLDIADAAIDPTKDLTITWSCDGSQTAGSGCTGTTDFLGVLLQTSTNTKGTFATPQPTKFGVGQCVEAVAKTSTPAYTATVTSAQLQALIGGQTGGSMQIAVVRLGVAIAPSGSHLVIYTAGHGQFGFTNF